MEKNLEIEISKTNRGKEQIILNRKYKQFKKKKKNKCTEYKTLNQCMGLICPGYNSIKSQVTRSRREKQLPPDITTFNEIPNEFKIL
ncbi:hypothetical protein H8356DRAFT_1421145 [Neocallimastix lanati (nom. inval.)]|nr:hypothetical protein H8356DRAFT_1421145 [Neocallimastix sp. JGI-2020a]